MNIIKKIKQIIKNNFSFIQEYQKYNLRYQLLIDKALNSTENGISKELYCENEVIVSLTTYGKRLYDVAATIESIMQGSLKPNRIVLWLGDDMKDTRLPVILKNQQNRGLEISYCKDIRSYTKLIPTLRKYPNANVITIDDDVLYHFDLVEKLINEHLLYPKHIISNRIHRIKLDKNNRPLKYMKWKWYDNPTDDSSLNFLTGVGGVLYPSHSLDYEVFNESVFLDICKYADDIWFYAMALKAGSKIKKGFTHNNKGEDYYVNNEVQDVGLCHINNGFCNKNDEQFYAVFDKYNLWELLN